MARVVMLLAAATALVGSSCPPDLPLSEQGSFMLEEHGMATISGYLPSGWTDEPVLSGELTCPTLVCQQQDCSERAPEDGGVAACFAHTVTGATMTDGCLDFDAAGDVVWALEPIACQPDVDAGVPLVGDRFLFRAVAQDAVVPEQAPQLPALAEAFMADGGVIAVPEPPADFAAPRDALYIVEGGAAPVSAALIEIASGAHVALEANSLVLEDVAPTPEAVRNLSGWVVAADPGATATLRLVTNRARFDVASIEGVPLAAAASLSLYAFYWTSPEQPGSTAPAAVHAIAHDAAGLPLDGAPVEWTLVQGDLAISDLVGAFGGAAAEPPLHRGPWHLVADSCRPPSARAGTSTALLRARLGELSQDLRLTWTIARDLESSGSWFGIPPTAPAEDDGFTRDAACPPGPACGCSSAARGARTSLLGAAALAAALLGVLARATRPSA